MSVKNKVKRCNKEIKRLEDELETYKLSNQRLREKLSFQNNNELLENIVKFALTNHIGRLTGGMSIDRRGIDKMQDLKLDVDYEPEYNSYILRVHYKGRYF